MAEITISAEDLQTVLDQRAMHHHSRPGLWDDDLAGEKPCAECAARRRLSEALAYSEPAEPPPGVYQDEAGCVYVCSDDALWIVVGWSAEWQPWAVVRGDIQGKLVRLWTAAELIPDPDDPDAMTELIVAAGLSPTSVDEAFGACAVIRALRARAESRVPTGGTDGN